MNYDETAVIDAIATDLEAVLNLPAHGLIKYCEPRALRKDQKDRYLAIFPNVIQHVVIATPDAYDNYLYVSINWYAPVFAGADHNELDDEVAKVALEEARLIRRHLQSYAAGVPGLVNVSATLSTTTFDVKGSTTWNCSMTIAVEEFEGGPVDG